MSAGVRLDRLLVDRGLAPSRERAQRLILAGQVLVDDRPVGKPGCLVAAAAAIRIRNPPATWASRGGEKLVAALDALGVDPRDRVCLDVGASTGGFTDVLLRRGARHVIALDVGYGQLAWRLRRDPRVTVLERTNARRLDRSLLPEPPGLVTVDVSFISLTLVLPPVRGVLAPEGEILALVKPQFEAGREHVGKGGVVRDPAVRAACVARICAAAEPLGLVVRGIAESVLPGPRGNRETFVWFRAARTPAQHAMEEG